MVITLPLSTGVPFEAPPEQAPLEPQSALTAAAAGHRWPAPA